MWVRASRPRSHCKSSRNSGPSSNEKKSCAANHCTPGESAPTRGRWTLTWVKVRCAPPCIGLALIDVPGEDLGRFKMKTRGSENAHRGVTMGMLVPMGTYGGAYCHVSKGQVPGSLGVSVGRKQSPNGQAPVSRHRIRSPNPSGRTKSESSSSGSRERSTSKNAFSKTAQAFAVP